jgi:hypothetical protein
MEAVGFLGQRGRMWIAGRAGVRGHPNFLGCGGGCRSLEGWVLLQGYDKPWGWSSRDAPILSGCAAATTWGSAGPVE